MENVSTSAAFMGDSQSKLACVSVGDSLADWRGCKLAVTAGLYG